MAGRPCKYGEKVNGKCPPKPKSPVAQAKATRKLRPCKYGERVNGKCPPKPKSPMVKAKSTRKQRPCKYGERVNGKCPPKPKVNEIKPAEKYAHHVKCTIEFYFSAHNTEPAYFKSEKELSDWFKSGQSYIYVYPDEYDEVFNFKYRAEIAKKRYGSKYYIHVEFDTNKDPNYIINEILGSMENNDPDGNYPVRGELVYGEIVDDSIYISNSDLYS